MKTTKIYKINDELFIATIKKVTEKKTSYYVYIKMFILGNSYVIMPSRDFNSAQLYLLLEDSCQGLLESNVSSEIKE